MRKKVWNYFKIIVPASAVLAACIASLFLIPFRANADGETITDDYIVKRSLYQGLSSCYQNSLASSIAVDSSGYSTRVDAIFSKDAPHLYLPTGFGSKSEYACKRKDAGFVTSAVPSLMSSLASSVSLGTAEARDKYFEGMGFVGSNSNGGTASGERCFWYEFSYGSISNAKSNTVCLTAGENGEVLSVSDEGGADNKGGDFSILISVSFEGRNYAGRLANCSSDAICLDAIFTYPDGMGYSFEQTISLYDQYLDAAKVDDIAQFIPAQAEAIASTAQFYAGSSTFTVTGESETKSDPGATTVDNNTYTSTGNTTDMLNKAITYLNGSNDSSLTEPFDDTELYYIYMDYLKDVYGAQIAYNFCADNSQGEAYIPVIRASENGEKYWQYCAIDNLSAVESSSQKVRTGSTMGSEEKASQVIDYLQAMNTANLDINRLTESELEESTVGVTDPDGEGEEAVDGDASTMAACYKSAGALGWILCPVVGGLSEAVNGIYGSIEENFLMVEPEVVGDDGAYNGWVIFRDFANLVFVILFIIVILSQVTGVGISNYGIKKTLPRLIVVVVLVNVSFILCQLAVDLSNILGASLNSLFVDLAGRIAGSSGVFDLGGTIGEIGNFLLTVSGAGVTIAGGIALGALTWEYWLVPFLLVLLTVVISIIFFFILLGVRKAGIIILVALAPIAIVCYALPNTKKIFDRWLKMLSGLLMVYPICGLLMGGGKFASTLILNNIGSSGDTSFILALVAMLLTAVPFFFIPSLLRSSMAAMGNLGAKISGFGSRLGHGASGAIKRSERVQDWNKRLRVNTQYRRAQRSMTRAEKKGRTVSASQARRIARAKAAYEKQGIEDATNQLYAGRSGAQIAAAVAAAGMAAEDKDVKEAAESIETQYRKSGMDYRLDDLQKEHMDALNTLIADPTNREAKARLMAAHNLLSATDPGRGIMKNNFYSATGRLQSQGVTESAGLAWAAQSLHRSQGGNIKSHDRGFEKYLTKAAEGLNKVDGSFTTGTIGQRDDGSLIQGTVSSHYDVDAMNGYTSSSLADVDEGVLDRWLQATKDGHAAQMSDVDKDNFLSMSENMLTNENISVQPKIAAKVNAIRKSLGASEITPAVRGTSSTDSGSLNPRTQTTGDVLRTGNDDHAPAQPASAPSAPARPVNPPAQPTSQPPVPNGATVTDSGLVIAHGDMSGEQIRDFARQMDDYNRRQGNNGQNNSSNGQNNRNR